MITTEEAKGIANILYLSGPRTQERVKFVHQEVVSIPDAFKINSDALMEHINRLYVEFMETKKRVEENKEWTF